MAKDKDSSTLDLEISDTGISMSAERRMVVLKAVWEIESLVRNVPVIAEQDDTEAFDLRDTLRCISKRIKMLTSVATSALDDSSCTVKEMQALLD